MVQSVDIATIEPAPAAPVGIMRAARANMATQSVFLQQISLIVDYVPEREPVSSALRFRALNTPDIISLIEGSREVISDSQARLSFEIPALPTATYRCKVYDIYTDNTLQFLLTGRMSIALDSRREIRSVAFDFSRGDYYSMADFTGSYTRDMMGIAEQQITQLQQQYADLLFQYQDLQRDVVYQSQIGRPQGIARLDSSGKLAEGQIPDISIFDNVDSNFDTLSEFLEKQWTDKPLQKGDTVTVVKSTGRAEIWRVKTGIGQQQSDYQLISGQTVTWNQVQGKPTLGALALKDRIEQSDITEDFLAYLLNRQHHTGSISIANVSGLQNAIDTLNANINSANQNLSSLSATVVQNSNLISQQGQNISTLNQTQASQAQTINA